MFSHAAQTQIHPGRNRCRRASGRPHPRARGAHHPRNRRGTGHVYPPQFYRMLFLLRAGLDENGVPSVLTHLTKLTCESVMKTYRVTQQQAERYTRDMWLVSHGIAALIVTNSCPYTDEQISRIFTGFSLSVYKSIKEIPGFAENDYDRDAEFRKLVEK